MTVIEEFTEGKTKPERIDALLSEFGHLFPDLVSDRSGYVEKLAQRSYLIIAKESTSNRDIGMIAFYANDPERKIAYITKTFVSPNYYGTGLADELIRRAFNVCINRGFENIAVRVLKNNSAAIGYYLRNGFIFSNTESELKDNYLYMIKNCRNIPK